jgi:hypothetical protein
VRDFLKQVPVVWDDVRFIDGFRASTWSSRARPGQTWYVAGINADRAPRKVKIDLKALGVSKQGALITDGIDFLGSRRTLSVREERYSRGDHDSPARRVRADIRIGDSR